MLVSRKGRYSYQRRIDYVVSKAEEENKSITPIVPQPVTDDIIILVTRISEAYLSNSIYPPGFFESIPSLSQKYTASVNVYFTDLHQTTGII